MQISLETKWKRNKDGKWSRIDVPSATNQSVTSKPVDARTIPSVSFRVRTGMPATSLAAKRLFAAIGTGTSIIICKGPGVKPQSLSAGDLVKGVSVSESSVTASLADGHLVEFDLKTGRRRAISPLLGGAPAGAPFASSDGWVVTLESGAIVSVDAKLMPRWRYLPPAGTYGFEPAMSVGRGVYVPSESTLYRLDAASGLVNWSVEVGERGCVTPVVMAGLTATAATAGGITCLDASTGKIRWRYGVEYGGGTTWTGIAAAGLLLVAASQQGDVICVNRETGRVEWVRTNIGRVMFAPIGDVKHGCAVVFVQDTDAGIPAEVLGLDLRSGRTNWRARVGNLDATPVCAGDRLWVASVTGTLYAFDYG